MGGRPLNATSTENLHCTAGLRSAIVRNRLNQIDRIRGQGIGDSISLPQLVVCGDQSSGKSSVLAGVTGFAFPRQEGTCTRFATEIVIRHSNEPEMVTASIIPSLSRQDGSKDILRRFTRTLESTEELPSVVNEASVAMGIRGYTDCDDSPAFASDVLRIEIAGDTGLCLTIVDLPGLISVSDYEEGDIDVQLINALVDGYLSNTRSIILAVVQATNDIQNQQIIQRARRFDRSGERTLGIITKPDLVNEGTESRVARLANNLDITKLKLGYFLLKNPSPEHLKNSITMYEWEQTESQFFDSVPWKDLNLEHKRVGVKHLRAFLQDILAEHIERELPKVCDEIQARLKQTRESVSYLGDERSSTLEQRNYLLKISMGYLNLVHAALHGRYQEVEPSFFGDLPSQSSPNRLRARVHELNSDFAAFMHEYGQKRKIVRNEEITSEGSDAKQITSKRGNTFPEPLWVSEERFMLWVRQVYKNTRGLELSGSHNHTFLSELFHEQSSRWPALAAQHIRRVNQEIVDFTQRALCFIVKDNHVNEEIFKIINPLLLQNFRGAEIELQKICDDEKVQPMTYNHYYTDTIQKARSSRVKDFVRQLLCNIPFSSDGYSKSKASPNYDRLLASIDDHIIPDMDQAACDDAIEELTAYYKVSLKTFVDNICRQVLERHIISKLPVTFYPTQIGMIPDEDIKKIASESAETAKKRQELNSLADALQQSLSLLSQSTGVLIGTE
ncbi:P-loop containing nucleoside triphosphate hydrolase protein [Aspergillus flavus]|uniref:P-loop containing nucleoside triphosphate hydrolase protein n=1 Tax=Aspergillus flavus TaxID=5059 RepID=A0A5N6GFC6_ASPFL|nr:P-loop containing nucleoside triphosphate hydrolase protein [Aspergillus flavus]